MILNSPQAPLCGHDPIPIFDAIIHAAKNRYAANIRIYHHHTNAPVIETYYPQPGLHARQRARLAAEAAAQDTPI